MTQGLTADMNYCRMLTADMANGLGIRVVLFVAGCHHHCKECHNPETWDFNAGIPFTGEAFTRMMEYVKQPHISGLTLSGGDPLAPENLPVTTQLAMEVHKIRKNVWVYTGYLYEEVKDTPIMDYTDILVDGEFKRELRDLRLRYRGSSNQRIIDVRKSREQGRVVVRSDLM